MCHFRYYCIRRRNGGNSIATQPFCTGRYIHTYSRRISVCHSVPNVPASVTMTLSICNGIHAIEDRRNVFFYVCVLSYKKIEKYYHSHTFLLVILLSGQSNRFDLLIDNVNKSNRCDRCLEHLSRPKRRIINNSPQPIVYKYEAAAGAPISA